MNHCKEIPYIKMHGIGTDYVNIDSMKGEKPDYLKGKKLSELSRKISDIHFGVGSEGLIMILPSDRADFRLHIFNAYGRNVKMCGKGMRFIGKYVYNLG